MKKAFLVLMMLLLAFSVFAAGKQEAAKGAEFILVNGAEPESLDPHLISGVPEHRIYESLFEGLLAYDAKTAEGVPGLAESWTTNADRTVYTFKLRKTTWSDGVPITAQTVVKSWLRMLDPETAAPYAWFPAMFIKGAEEYNAGEAGPEAVKIRAVDDYTFEMELVGPLPYVEGALPHYSFAVVPIHAIEKFGTDWTKPANFVGNGPFVLETWRPQETLTCIPNERYWDRAAVKLGRVTYIPLDDNNTGYNMYINGEVDWMTTVPLDQLEAAQKRPDYHVSAQLATYYYLINNTVAPFNDARVRRALSMSIDRTAMVNQVTRAGQIPAFGITPSMTGYEATKGNGYDIAGAKKLLAEAGYPNGSGFPKFQVLYNTSEGHKKIGEFIQQEWLVNLGIQCELFNQEWATYLATRREGDFQVSRAGWVGDYQDPNTFLDMFVTGGAMNDIGYSSKEYDDLIAKAARMNPGKERMAVLKQAEEVFITKDAAIIPLYYYVNINMIDLTKWGGWYDNVMDYHPVKDIYKK